MRSGATGRRRQTVDCGAQAQPVGVESYDGGGVILSPDAGRDGDFCKMKSTPFVIHRGECYVQAKAAGMSFLSLVIDSVDLWYFDKKRKTPHIKLQDAIDWHEYEIQETNGEWPREALNLLLKAKQTFAETVGKTATT
jgi:hypothetical protein